MRREDLQLRQLAKTGDIEACLKLGEAYLTGSPGISKNISIGVSYLKAAFPKAQQRASISLSTHLSLKEIVKEDLIFALKNAAENDEIARLKLSAWHFLRCETEMGEVWLQRCTTQLLDSTDTSHQKISVGKLLSSLHALRIIHPTDVSSIIASEARSALNGRQPDRCIQILSVLSSHSCFVPLNMTLHQLICDIVAYAETFKHDLGHLPADLIEQSLERCSAVGDLKACHILGRSLAGYPCGHLPAKRLVRSQNLRKSVALLLRSGDSGVSMAWLHLFRICSDYRSSVANPTMARFCLEKAAKHGIAEAERCLGVMILRESVEIDSMESGMKMLHSAANKGDPLARSLLCSFVLPVFGPEDEAQSAISEIQEIAPLLAMRLRLARAFGLTKLEALSMNINATIRPWGIVLEKNTQVAKGKLAEPRVIPATTEYAMTCLEIAANLFSSKSPENIILEGSLRARSLQLRRLLQKLHIQERFFFSSVSSQQREAIRLGTKWAKVQKEIIKEVF